MFWIAAAMFLAEKSPAETNNWELLFRDSRAELCPIRPSNPRYSFYAADLRDFRRNWGKWIFYYEAMLVVDNDDHRRCLVDRRDETRTIRTTLFCTAGIVRHDPSVYSVRWIT